MKKFLVASLLILAMFLFVSCVSDDEETDGTNDQSDSTADTGSSDTGSPSDTGNTGSSDTGSDTDSSDTGNADTGTDTDPSDTGNTDPVVTPDGCIGFSIDSKIKFYSGIYVTKITDNILGDHSLQDQLVISFPENIAEAGTYDLTSTSNKNYSTCTECVLVLEDVNTSGQVTREYFQTSGTLTINEVDDSYGINGTVSATLEEVTIADEDGGYLSTPVPNGKCVEIESGIFSGICVPNCKAEDGTDKICGDDGCGHECGEGCGTDLACSADQKECVPYECETVTINQFERVKMTVPSYYEFQSTLTPNIGESASDLLSFQIYYGEKMNKVWDLAGTNLNNCQLCLLVAEDQGKRFYFQQKGTIDLSREPDKDSNFFNPTEGTMNNISVQGLRLIESKIDTFDNIATPVPGGKCLEITNTIFNYN